MTYPLPNELRRAGWFTALLLLVNVVGDGWSGRPSGLAHQLLLLPVTAAFCIALFQLLFNESCAVPALWTGRRSIFLAILFEVCAAGIFLFECRHFALFGYRLHPAAAALVFVPVVFALILLASSQTARAGWLFAVSLAGYAGGMLLASASFPLNYLRSDMLPVILWADTSVLRHIDPYTTLHVGIRIYDFPYLPGMIVAYLPFAAMHCDLRLGSIAYMAATASLIFWAARQDRRREVAALLALFLLCPFLQYRHDLYLQPHWFALVAAFVLAQRRHFGWAAIVFGASMALYQFSWIVFPFFLLNALRRRGWLEAGKLALFAALGALAVAGPFLASASRRIASNTVGQWGLLPHALADPINLSYWATYFIHPDKLLRLQAVLMIAIFLYCFARKHCGDLAGTLRWSVLALTVFILFNVLVDGYFYLMLLVVMLLYTCVANGWWCEPAAKQASIPLPS